MVRKRKARAEDVDVEPREVGTVVLVDETTGLSYEVRKDGSIAYFTQEKAEAEHLREVGS